MTKVFTIDAAHKKLGRVATEAAGFLMGKNDTSFARHQNPDVEVRISNAAKLSITEKKMVTKEYKRFSGYPSGLKKTPLSRLVREKGYREALRKAVYGMLPGNKLRARMMKRLVITD